MPSYNKLDAWILKKDTQTPGFTIDVPLFNPSTVNSREGPDMPIE
jgi:hypothetical protein